MIHRFVDLIEDFCGNRGFAVLAPGGGGSPAAVWFGHHNRLFTELATTRVASGSLGDPTVSPDNCLVAYTSIPNSGLVNYLTVAATNGASPFVDIASEPNGLSTGTNTTMFPRWSPDSSRIAYHGLELEDVTVDATIHVVDPDGSNNDTVYSEPTVIGDPDDPGNVPGRAFCPQWSDDGTKILFFRGGQQDSGPFLGTDRTIYTMNPDGTGVVQVASTCFFTPAAGGAQAFVPCFLAGTTQVVYVTTNGTNQTNGDYEVWRVDADGTGATLIYTDPVDVATHTNGFFGVTPGPFGSLPDGSGVVYLQNDLGEPSNFDYVIGVVDATSTGSV